MLTRVFIAEPGLPDQQCEANMDISKIVDNTYYRGEGTHDLTPRAYCYRLAAKEQIICAFKEMQDEENEMEERHYKRLIGLRIKYGI